jgi:tRNA G46 methylase TrmB
MHLRQFQAQRMQAPRDFQAIENQPVCVEIGAGKGKHAVLFGQQQPQSSCMRLNELAKNLKRCKNSINYLI